MTCDQRKIRHKMSCAGVLKLHKKNADSKSAPRVFKFTLFSVVYVV